MTTKNFNLVAVIVFILLGIATFIAGFYNWFHFVLCGICVVIAVLAFFDDTDGKSLYQRLKIRFEKQ